MRKVLFFPPAYASLTPILLDMPDTAASALVAAGVGAYPFGSPIIVTPTPTPTTTITLSGAQSKTEDNSGPTIFEYTISRDSSAGYVEVQWAFNPGTTSPDDFTGGTYPTGGVVRVTTY